MLHNTKFERNTQTYSRSLAKESISFIDKQQKSETENKLFKPMFTF